MLHETCHHHLSLRKELYHSELGALCFWSAEYLYRSDHSKLVKITTDQLVSYLGIDTLHVQSESGVLSKSLKTGYRIPAICCLKLGLLLTFLVDFVVIAVGFGVRCVCWLPVALGRVVRVVDGGGRRAVGRERRPEATGFGEGEAVILVLGE